MARNIRLQFDELPVMPIVDEDGKPVTVCVDLPGREVSARIWEVHVGRVPLYLLDSDVEGNTPADRELTARLYNSDLDSRISQEIILGIGGVRALRLLGYNPGVWHMNEGHSAFMGLERALEMVAAGHFREDLFYRINLITLALPPLRERRDDIPLLTRYFVENLGTIYRRDNLTVSPKALQWLAELPWSGNVRELKNLVERTVLISDK